MKSHGMAFVVFLLLGGSVLTYAQALSPAEEAQQLRTELRGLLDQEAQIEMRLQELDYELKPENIERHFAGYGSTRPEELREARRKKLQTEKDRLRAQLGEIAQDRSRLDAAILNAEARAYYVSAMQNSTATRQNRMSPLAGLMTGRTGVAAIVFGVILVGVIVTFIRKHQAGSF